MDEENKNNETNDQQSDKSKCICNFCKKEIPEDKYAFRAEIGKDVLICEDCVKVIAKSIMSQDEYNSPALSPEEEKICDDIFNENQHLDNMTPSKIKEYFDKYVINQDNAKKILAVAVYNHYKRTHYNMDNPHKDFNLKKSNILMVGPSGSGKTLLVETMAKILDVPMSINDATAFTEAGYVGEDVENCLKRLIDAANGDVKKAERGIVFIDEIDKIGRKGENASITRDVSGEGVQQALLKMFDGAVVSVPVNGGRKHPQGQMYEIDTSNILFICAGAFEGIDKVVKDRVVKGGHISMVPDEKGKAPIDKHSKYNEVIPYLTTRDLIKYGMMPELLGRLQVLCTLNELDTKSIRRILTEPVDSITKQYQKLFELDGIKLNFTDGCLEEIARKTLDTGTGARALKSIMEKFMTKYMYDAPDNKDLTEITLTKRNVTDEAV